MDSLSNNFQKRLPKLYETGGIENNSKIAWIKLDHAQSKISWYLVEGEKIENDFIFWGMIKNENRLTSDFFSLNDLGSLAQATKSNILEDQSFSPTKLSLIQ